MRRRIRSVCVVALVLSASLAQAQTTGRLVFPKNGWSIAPLEQVTDTQVYQTLMMFLPSSESFAPNVNVQIQLSDWSMEEFAEVSRGQFVSAGLTILREQRTSTLATWEYSGTMSGYTLHWFTAVHMLPGRFYVVTATATEGQWASVGETLKTSVLSFRLEPN